MKKIIVFADGTGNAFTTQESNVWRLFQSIDKSTPDQIARYIRGVGTSGSRPYAIIDGATGIGVPSNVRELYRFICWNYEEGDQIWMFGFSRGAFTIRCLARMLDSQGLVPLDLDGSRISRKEMHRASMMAWREYRRETAPSKTAFPTILLTRMLRDVFLKIGEKLARQRSYAQYVSASREQKRAVVPVTFLGLFDTVEAFGVPIEELRTAIDRVVWPISFRNQIVAKNVQHVRQALSIDDERTSFQPIRCRHNARNPSQSIKEVWFAGVHSDVGGGYPDGALSYEPLLWMSQEAQSLNLTFAPGTAARFAAIATPYGPLHDSRMGLAVAYRYQPRRIEADFDGRPPVVHHSVIEKLKLGSDGYGPVGLPGNAQVLLPDGLASIGPPEDGVVSQLDIERARANLPRFRDEGINHLPKPDERYIRLTADTVWWRRVAYLALVCALAAIVALPWIAPAANAAIKSMILKAASLLGLGDWGYRLWAFLVELNGGLSAGLGTISDPLDGIVPSYARSWVVVFLESPLISLTLLAVTFLIYRWNSDLRDAIADHARCAWIGGVSPGRSPLSSRLARGIRRSRPLRAVHYVVSAWLAPYLLLSALVLGAYAIGSHMWMDARAARGDFCTPSETAPRIVGTEVAKIRLDPKALCLATGYQLSKGDEYEFRLTVKELITDGDPLVGGDSRTSVGLNGFENGNWGYRLKALFRRKWDAAWFQPFARVGPVNGEDHPIRLKAAPVNLSDDDEREALARCMASGRTRSACLVDTPAEREKARAADMERLVAREAVGTVRPGVSGELFLFLNDAWLAFPGGAHLFYGSNMGLAEVTIRRIPAAPAE